MNSSRSYTRPALVLLVAVIYLIAGKLGLRLAFANPSATAVWPLTKIALAALLILGYRVCRHCLWHILGKHRYCELDGDLPRYRCGNALEAQHVVIILRGTPHPRQTFPPLDRWRWEQR
jgi:hypothetical protein